ncbi:hypothetical protein RIF29_47005 [Crotalaria pallida]|uniref:Uncharacterized protein n=1 Tax=Crotalaria pallida TaxID=3830 RepID=A0AAN9DUE7_CROPI
MNGSPMVEPAKDTELSTTYPGQDKSEFPSLLSSKKSRIPPRLKKRTPIQPSSIPVKPYQYAWEQCSSCHY